MAGIPRSRGALSGGLLILLGGWGALVPFVGPYFGYAYTPDNAWHFTLARVWLENLPGGAAVLGGVLIMVSARRLLTGGGAILALLGGAWFAVGSVLGPIWSGTRMNPGTPVGGTAMRAVEQVGFFTGLGIVIVLIAAMALDRCFVASLQPAGPDGEASVRAGSDSTAASGFSESTAGSGSFPARADDAPGESSYSP